MRLPRRPEALRRLSHVNDRTASVPNEPTREDIKSAAGMKLMVQRNLTHRRSKLLLSGAAA
jgi:hypothetical protein